jgi:hypothetical protein
MQQLKAAGLDVGLVALAHGPRDVEKKFRSRARKLGLGDRILQIPFLPHWRVPEFLRGCLAVCCLEQDFPIGFHSPIIPLETLLCGSCLVASTEVIRKLPLYGRLAHGYGCSAIENVKDVEALSKQLAAIARDPQPADAVGARGCRFARELQASVQFPQTLERILEHAAARKRMPSTVLGTSRAGEADDNRFFLTRLAAAAIQDPAQNAAADTTISRPVIDLSRAREIKAAIAKRTAASGATLAALIPAIEVEIAIATAEDEAASAADVSDPLFRLRISRWAMAENDLDRLVPLRDPSLRVLEFDYDVAEFMDVRTIEDLPAPPTRRPSHMVVFGSATDEPRMPLVVDGLTARILDLSDGSRTVSEIVKELGRQVGPSEEQDNVKWLERIFVHGLISLQEARIGGASGDILDQIDLDRRHRGPPRARAVRPTRS